MFLYNVDGWKVLAQNPYAAKAALGRYHDLPPCWYERLPAVFLGHRSRVQLTGKEIA